jgi:hypothetical protein
MEIVPQKSFRYLALIFLNSFCIFPPLANQAAGMSISLSARNVQLNSSATNAEVTVFGQIDRKVLSPELRLKLKGPRSFRHEIVDRPSMLTPTLFRELIGVPANSPAGIYKVNVRLYDGGKLVATKRAQLEVLRPAN